jgi:hypothetical protein
VIGSLVLSSVISFDVMFGPMLKSRVSTTFDHECEITLAIHAAIPDVIRDTNRAGSGCLMYPSKRFEWNSLARPALVGKDTHPITAARRRYKSKGPFDDR